MNSKPRLFVINTNYPFGKTETFLENEILAMADYFDTIFLFPLNYPNKDHSIRTVPRNVTFFEPVLKDGATARMIQGIFNTAPAAFFVKEFFCMLVRKPQRLTSNLRKLYLATVVFRSSYSSGQFKFIQKNLRENDVVYFYWMGSRVMMSSYMFSKRTARNTFIRVHGGEVDMKRQKGYIPILDLKLKLPATFLPVSETTNTSLKELNGNITTALSRLGTYDHGLSKRSEDGIFRIVSCSNVIALKRVPLIAQALRFIEDIPISWTHFGDGVQMNLLQNEILKLPANVQVRLPGRIPNSQVLGYYASNPVDLFINVSTFEGIPVSIMEALSFGIPCIATNAGATGELVNDQVGELIDIQCDAYDLARIIKRFVSGQNLQMREASRKRWEAMCNAEVQYKKLVSILTYNEMSP